MDNQNKNEKMWVSNDSMTCFWDGIMISLGSDDKESLGLRDGNIYSLIDTLKEKNRMTAGVKWQHEELSEKHQI